MPASSNKKSLILRAAISCGGSVLAAACHSAAISSNTGATSQHLGDVVVFRGMCDASGAVELGAARFAVADDEDNVLRVYDSDRGGEPLFTQDVSSSLDLPIKKKTPEADIEAATRLGEHALWLTSHGLNSKGELQPARFRFFATKGAQLAPHGVAYQELLRDMLEAPELAPFKLAEAIMLPPKTGGLNIEGMARGLDEHSVVLGFRSPRPRERALLVPLLNPLELVEASDSDEAHAPRARFGTAQLLDLGGLGIRALVLWRGQYLVVAGAPNQEATSKLYLWDGAEHVQPVPDIDLNGFNPEAIVAREDSERVLLLSDDGTQTLDGVTCKKTKDHSRKQFRGLWIQLKLKPGAAARPSSARVPAARSSSD